MDTQPDYVRVRLGDVELWAERRALEPGGNGALAPLHHVSDGELDLAHCFGGDSYAHVFEDGQILRYHERIGRREDLEVIEEANRG